MNVRWTAVLTGFLVDLLASLIIQSFASDQFFTAPDLAQPGNLAIIALLTFSTGVGGYIAGRMAQQDRALNGFLVGIVGVLIGVLGGGSLPRPFVVASAIGCLLAALGGYVSRFPPAQREKKRERQR